MINWLKSIFSSPEVIIDEKALQIAALKREIKSYKKELESLKIIDKKEFLFGSISIRKKSLNSKETELMVELDTDWLYWNGYSQTIKGFCLPSDGKTCIGLRDFLNKHFPVKEENK